MDTKAKDDFLKVAIALGFVLELDKLTPEYKEQFERTKRDAFMRLRYSKAEVTDSNHAVIIYEQDLIEEYSYTKLTKALIKYGKQKAINKITKSLNLR